jgi:glutathione reductase (NADPH)
VGHFHVRGVFVDSHQVQLGSRTISAEKILVATGGRPWAPDIPGHEHTITSNQAFDLEALPARVAVIGGGYIACEFAGIFNGLGAETILIYRGDALLRGFDEDVRRMVTAELPKKGVDLRLERSRPAHSVSASVSSTRPERRATS